MGRGSTGEHLGRLRVRSLCLIWWRAGRILSREHDETGFALCRCWGMYLKAACSLLKELQGHSPALLLTVLVTFQTCNLVVSSPSREVIAGSQTSCGLGSREASLLCLKEGTKSTATHYLSESEAKGHTEGSTAPRHGQFLLQSCRLANPLPGRAQPDRAFQEGTPSPRPLKTECHILPAAEASYALRHRCSVSPHFPVELQHPPGSWEG